MRYLRASLLLFLIGSAAAAFAGNATVESPSTAQTYSYHTILWRQLRWLPASRTLVASITFSNVEYQSSVESRRDERFDFALPGVEFDPAQGVFSVRGENGERVAVATIRRGWLGREIELAPSARIEIKSRDGKIHIALTVSDAPVKGAHWVEHGG